MDDQSIQRVRRCWTGTVAQEQPPEGPFKTVHWVSLDACAPQKVHTKLMQRVSPANTHGGVRRERQRVEPHGPQEYDGGARSPARADVAPQVFPAQDSCAAARD